MYEQIAFVSRAQFIFAAPRSVQVRLTTKISSVQPAGPDPILLHSPTVFVSSALSLYFVR